jgi:tetratricopeptide (TPR) repeat protein
VTRRACAHDPRRLLLDIERAIESFRTALRLDPGSCTAAINLGNALEQAGRPEEARREWQLAVERDPTCEGAKRALGGR